MIKECKHRCDRFGQTICLLLSKSRESVQVDPEDDCGACQSEWRGGTPPEECTDVPYLAAIDNGKPPALLTRLANYSIALASDLIAGRPRRSESQQLAILAICEGCRINLRGICTHPKCGCVLTEKTKWALEECPVGKWPKLDGDDPWIERDGYHVPPPAPHSPQGGCCGGG